jgi:hypothetical protein
MSDDWGDDPQESGDGDDGGDWGDDGAKEEGGEWENAEFDEDAGGDADAVEDGAKGAGSNSGGAAANLSPDIQIANLFYEAEDIRRENPPEALAKFRQVVALAQKAKDEKIPLNEESKTNHFNSIVHIVCLLYQLHRDKEFGSSGASSSAASNDPGLKEMVSQYTILLDFIPHVTRNESGDAIDRVLSIIGTSKNFDFLLSMYEVTLQRLKGMPDTERMQFNVRMKLCKTYIEKGDFNKGLEVSLGPACALVRGRFLSTSKHSALLLFSCFQVLAQLLQSCQTPAGVDDKKNKGSELLEIYALQIQISSRRGDGLKVRRMMCASSRAALDVIVCLTCIFLSHLSYHSVADEGAVRQDEGPHGCRQGSPQPERHSRVSERAKGHTELLPRMEGFS